MSTIRKLHGWLFAPLPEDASPLRIIGWWEARRIPFNLILGCWGLLWLEILLRSSHGSSHFGPGEDVFEPILLPMFVLFVNAAYTLGWIVALGERRALDSPNLLRRGLGIGLTLTALPGLWWLGISMLQQD
jgi:hypothetical protein